MPDGKQHSSEKEASRANFDLLVTFEDEPRAREALMALRREGFTTEQAMLLQPESSQASSDPFSLDGTMRFSPDELAADRTIAITIIIATEVAVGAIAGAVVGWLVSLFLNAPEIGPLLGWMLGLGALGALAGAGLGSFEWKRWSRELEKLRRQAAIGLRFSGRHPADGLQRARTILERYGGSGIDNT
jgi:hypothetical protein